MKKIIMFILVLAMTMTFCIPTYASEVEVNEDFIKLSTLTMNYEIMLGSENRTFKEIYDELLEFGYNKKDAEYYAKMDILFNQLKLNEINIVKALDQVVATNGSSDNQGVRKKALELDLAALKNIISSNEAIEKGYQDIAKVKDENLIKSGEFKYTLNYADGSAFSYSSSTSLEDESELVANDSTKIVGTWDKVEKVAVDILGADGDYVTSSSISINTGAGTVTVKDIYRWTLDYAPINSKVYYRSDDGSSTAGGYLTRQYVDASNHVNTSATDSYAIQGFTRGGYESQLPVTFNFEGGSFTLSVNQSLNFYCITEVLGWGTVIIYSGVEG